MNDYSRPRSAWCCECADEVDRLRTELLEICRNPPVPSRMLIPIILQAVYGPEEHE